MYGLFSSSDSYLHHMSNSWTSFTHAKSWFSWFKIKLQYRILLNKLDSHETWLLSVITYWLKLSQPNKLQYIQWKVWTQSLESGQCADLKEEEIALSGASKITNTLLRKLSYNTAFAESKEQELINTAVTFTDFYYNWQGEKKFAEKMPLANRKGIIGWRKVFIYCHFLEPPCPSGEK